jgi:cupin fold WbuC family metalloprotein
MTLDQAKSELETVADTVAEGVYHCRSWGNALDTGAVSALGTVALFSRSGKARLCMHPSTTDAEQQMLVAISSNCADRIHLHPNKAETLLLVEGRGVHVTYDLNGTELSRTTLGQDDFTYVNTQPGIPHHVLVKSKILIFWEFSRGPFGPDSTVFMDF